MSDAPALLVASFSARALTQSAQRGGFQVFAIDGFGDVDTCVAAASVHTVPFDERGFEFDPLVKATAQLAEQTSISGWVYGSGLEARPELIERLGQQFRLYGNLPQTVAEVKAPETWSRALKRLAIVGPATSLTPPPATDGWLMKRKGGSGGWHVRSAASAQHSDEWFYQRRITGPVYSVLFLADGAEACIVGFNRQSTYADTGGSGFGYAGAISRPALPPSVRDTVSRWVSRLVSYFELRGLNGIDFVVSNGSQPYLLELNPRPTATLELWDDDWADGLVSAHIRACNGELPDRIPETKWVRGHAVVYANTAFSVPDEFVFPNWCEDLPQAGSLVRAGEPICSVTAKGSVTESVRLLMGFRRDWIQRYMGKVASGQIDDTAAGRCVCVPQSARSFA